MLFRIPKALVIGCMALCMFFPAWAAQPVAAGSATALLKDVSDQLIARLEKDKATIKTDPHAVLPIVDQIIMPITDFELIAKRVLGQNWRNATAEQRQAFLKEFKLLLIVTYMAAFRSYEDQTVEFLGERPDPNDSSRVEVKTLIKEPGAAPIPVNYRLHQQGSSWKVYDFNVDGVGLTSSFRAQFNDAIRQKGIEQMLKDMHTKNESVFGPGA